MKFHHIGIACNNIEIEIENIKRIHNVNKISEIVYDNEQDASLCIIEIENGISIELISGNIVKNYIKKHITYYHVCYEIYDINIEIERLTSLGAILISKVKPAILFNGRKVAFLQLSYGLIELLETKK